MKKSVLFLLSILFVCGIANSTQAQNNLPKEGAIIRFEKNQIEAVAGKKISVPFQLIRSKFYQKQQSPLHISANATKGINIVASPEANTTDNGTLDITIDKNLPAGQYTITVQKSPTEHRVIKGAFLTLTVTAEDVAIKE
jgi:hypothetical protein